MLMNGRDQTNIVKKTSINFKEINSVPQVLGCCVFIFISFYAYFDFFFDFLCDLLVIQKCVVHPPYVGIFNSFSPVIEI